MPRPLRCFLGLILLAPLVLVLPIRGDPKPAAEEASVLARFPVATDGDALLLPVTFKGKTYHFLLDTGSNLNFFDPVLPLEGAGEENAAQTPTGTVAVRTVAAPEATLGKFSLRTKEPALVADLSWARQGSDLDIHGGIGMSFLRRHVVRLDFDRGEVLFLKSAGGDSGEAFPLAWDRGAPIVNLELPGWGREWFHVDTGDVGEQAGTLSTPLVDGLVQTGLAEVIGTSVNTAAGGTMIRRGSRLKSVRLGESTTSNILFRESQISTLGLGFLSRFVVTIDFPNGTLYLKKGKQFDKPFTVNQSGLDFTRKNGKTVVADLGKGSPAEAAGFKAGDVLVQVGAKKAAEASLLQLRSLLATEAKELRVTVRRGAKEIVLTLDLSPPPKK
jgi:hypothetical protein